MAEAPKRIAEIERLVTDLEKRRNAVITRIRELQATCLHEKVVEAQDGADSRRICCACGLEELVPWGWPGTTVDGGFYRFMVPAGRKSVLNTEFVKRGDVTQYRVRL